MTNRHKKTRAKGGSLWFKFYQEGGIVGEFNTNTV